VEPEISDGADTQEELEPNQRSKNPPGGTAPLTE